MASIEAVESMGMMIHTKYPPIVTKDTLATLQEEMVVVQMETNMPLPVAMDTTLTFLVEDTMVITVSPVVVMVALWMIHIVKV